MQVSYKDKKPTLYLVPTPIGNLGDITNRACEILEQVETIFAEDTRVTGMLLKHLNIKTKMSSYHEHQKYEKISEVIEALNKGFDVALVSDAGTPGISDPGQELVEAVIDAGYYVVSIPGAVASITALVASGLVIQPHLFVGFLPRKVNEIKTELTKYKNLDATLIFYESPHRVEKTIQVLYETYGDRRVVIARELTKIYETYIRTTLQKALELEYVSKGEYVILVEGKALESSDLSIEELYQKYRDEGYDDKEILGMIAKELNIPKKDVYRKIKVEK